LSKETSEVGFFREDKFDSDDFGGQNFDIEGLVLLLLYSKNRAKLAANLDLPLKAAILIMSLSSGNPIKVKST
jgi:hypothetical protein